MLGRTSVTNGPRASNGKEALLDIRQQGVVCAGVGACAQRVRVCQKSGGKKGNPVLGGNGRDRIPREERERREREMISWNRIIRRNGDHLFFSCSFRFLARLLSLPFLSLSASSPFLPWSGALSLTKLTQVTAQQPNVGCESCG